MAEAPQLQDQWRSAAADLGIAITVPFSLRLSSGSAIQVQVLVGEFGAVNGMMVVLRDQSVLENHEEITKAGYGFSVMSEVQDNETYEREEFVGLLSDWGWSGDPTQRPSWVRT